MRLEAFINEIEALKNLVGRISEDRLVSQAYDNAVANNRGMPKSKNIIFEYGAILRSLEPYKSQYETVFRKNA